VLASTSFAARGNGPACACQRPGVCRPLPVDRRQGCGQLLEHSPAGCHCQANCRDGADGQCHSASRRVARVDAGRARGSDAASDRTARGRARRDSARECVGGGLHLSGCRARPRHDLLGAGPLPVSDLPMARSQSGKGTPFQTRAAGIRVRWASRCQASGGFATEWTDRIDRTSEVLTPWQTS